QCHYKNFLMSYIHVRERKVVPADRQNLEVLIDCPTGADALPALIQAPGLKYDMHRPAIASPAEHLSANGVAVYRFN
ncbi:hypothetical protein ABTH88_23190, partial [Acinetobacter baumannii]